MPAFRRIPGARPVSAPSLLLASLLVDSLAFAPAVVAQSCDGAGCTVDHTVSVTVDEVLSLTLSSSTTTLTSPDDAAFLAGSQDDAGPDVTVRGNRVWNVEVAATTGVWDGTSGARPDKPVGDLNWATDGSTFTSLSTTPAALFGSAQAASAGAVPQASLTWRTTWNATDDLAGDYSLIVEFTLIAP